MIDSYYMLNMEYCGHNSTVMHSGRRLYTKKDNTNQLQATFEIIKKDFNFCPGI